MLLIITAYVALELLALFGVFDREIICHLGEFDAVCLLTVFSLKGLRNNGQCTFIEILIHVKANM